MTSCSTSVGIWQSTAGIDEPQRRGAGLLAALRLHLGTALRQHVRLPGWRPHDHHHHAGPRHVALAETKSEPYWPGMFICYVPKTEKTKSDSAMILIRGDQMGRDMYGPRITEAGWWTLGMSFTPDGMVHYYAHAGVEDLTGRDHIGSYYPYGFRCEYFSTFFFDLINRDDGVTLVDPVDR